MVKKDCNIKILFTGGFESSFRMVQLSRHNVVIQPYYLSDEKRRSESQELMAISEIISDIEKHPETRCTIKPLIIEKVSDIPASKEVTSSFLSLNSPRKILGNQYEWLARYAKIHPGIELCIEIAEHNKTDGCNNCITTYGSVKKVKYGEIEYCIIDHRRSQPDIINLFGNFHFPYPLFYITKKQLAEEYKKLGFEHTMHKTWFCHNPVKGEPCGLCTPCKSTIVEGLSFRLSRSGLKRYRFEQKYKNTFWFGPYKRIRKRLFGY